nr:DUF1294 domain-containing protein [Leifsonia sp. Leaf325]
MGASTPRGVGERHPGAGRPSSSRPPRSRSSRSRRPEAAGWVWLVAFAVLYVVVLVLWSVPLYVDALYVAGSVLSFVLYGVDKGAAVAGRRRIPEATLHLVAVLGGWPGAVVGQTVFRHKTQKASFRLRFWATVIVNVIAFVVVTTPLVFGR